MLRFEQKESYSHIKANFVGVPDSCRAGQVRTHVLKKLQQSIQKMGGRVAGIDFVDNPLGIRKNDVDKSDLVFKRVGGAQWCLENDSFRVTMAFKTEIRGPDSLELTRVMKHNAGSVKALLRERKGIVKDWASLEVREALQNVVLEHQQSTTAEDLCWICGKPRTITNQDGVHRCMVKSRFSCHNCGHKWGSGCAWINPQTQEIKSQLCSKCGDRGSADSKWEAHPIEKKRGQVAPMEKQHRADLCEACLEWGDCRSNFLQPNVVNGAIALACGAQNMHWYADEEGIKTKLVYNGHENEVVIEPFVRVRINDQNNVAEKNAINFFNQHIAPQHNNPSPIVNSAANSVSSSEFIAGSAESVTGSISSKYTVDRSTVDAKFPPLRRGPPKYLATQSTTAGSVVYSDSSSVASGAKTPASDPGPSYLGANFSGTVNKRRDRKRNARHRRKKKSNSVSAVSETSSESNDLRTYTAGSGSGGPPSSRQFTSPPGSAAGSIVSQPLQGTPSNTSGNSTTTSHPGSAVANSANDSIVSTPRTTPNLTTSANDTQRLRPQTTRLGRGKRGATQSQLDAPQIPRSPGHSKTGDADIDPRAFVDRLEQLCRMRRHGTLTEDEFERLKTAMLFA